jgi:hypothetical protein
VVIGPLSPHEADIHQAGLWLLALWVVFVLSQRLGQQQRTHANSGGAYKQANGKFKIERHHVFSYMHASCAFSADLSVLYLWDKL